MTQELQPEHLSEQLSDTAAPAMQISRQPAAPVQPDRKQRRLTEHSKQGTGAMQLTLSMPDLECQYSDEACATIASRCAPLQLQIYQDKQMQQIKSGCLGAGVLPI